MDRARCVTGKPVLNRLIECLFEVLTNELVITTAVARPFTKMDRSRQAELMLMPHALQTGSVWPHCELASDRFSELARPLEHRREMQEVGSNLYHFRKHELAV